ncbi:MAG TPA: hypothetical protein VER32_02460 [Pyrinomonadaceae bacterium]|nr:hypothetical protein [Pyrinomonadaceae bacterium]
MFVLTGRKSCRPAALALALLLSLTPAAPFATPSARAQEAAAPSDATLATAAVETAAAAAATPAKPFFRLETIPVGGGAELLTIFGRPGALPREDARAGVNNDAASANGARTVVSDAAKAAGEEVPLVSILRDTLGDDNPENDRLRYVWMLSYTRPSALQRVASVVPFLYTHVRDKNHASRTEPPPHVLDLSSTGRDVWERFMWLALQNVVFNPYGVIVKSTTTAFSHNRRAYRQAHIMRALAVLALYEAETGDASAFTAQELHEIQARLMLSDKIFGGIVDDAYLERYYQNQTVTWRDTRGHNWELLRQRAEAEGLYFEPLQMPDGEPTHALLYVAREDLQANAGRKFGSRFLNIASPWRDRKLLKWKGHTETRHFDADGRPVAEAAAGGRTVELIPLALYGLDHPKIPAILVDFRDGANPKRREMSRRLIEDVARNVLAISKFGDLHYLLGRTVYDFATGRRGMDLNQPTRLRSYTQLKLLLSLSASLDPEMRGEIEKRLERVSLNPLENDMESEARLARQQYAALVSYARRPGGLAARLGRDRREELVPLRHGRASRVVFRLANILSLGTYRHREDVSAAEGRELLDEGRRLAYHRRFLREVSKSTPVVEVVWNIEDVRRSLRFVAENGSKADAKTSRAAARIFERTRDEETRRLCLHSLYRINNETAKNELLRIHQTPGLDSALRALSAQYLSMAMRERQRIKPSDAKAIAAAIGGQ